MSGWGSAKAVGLLQREKEYGERVGEWLVANFPELCDGRHPHPAAFTAVIRLHGLYGKGRLTRSQHGPMIRSAVQRFQKELQ